MPCKNCSMSPTTGGSGDGGAGGVGETEPITEILD
jgi:hypothetical protein